MYELEQINKRAFDDPEKFVGIAATSMRPLSSLCADDILEQPE